MNVEQIFYGRGADGYAILGSSVPSCGLTDQVLELCQSVGTPGFEREDDNQPFLLQKVCGANVLMVCGRNGDPDSLGRKTLFFHAVVVSLAYAELQKISASDLYCADVFSAKCRDGKLSVLEIDHVKGASDSHSCGFKLPAVFSCRRANNLALVKLLDGKLVGANWATMSWKALPNFDWFGLDSSCHLSGVSAEYSVYDGDGKLLRESGETRTAEKSCVGGIEHAAQSNVQKGGNMKKGIAFGVVGLVLGLVLGWSVWGNAKTQPDMERDGVEEHETQVEIEQRVRADLTPKIEKEVEARLRPVIKAEEQKACDEKVQALKTQAQAEKPCPVFNEKYRIMDFEKEMKVDDTYKQAVDEPKNSYFNKVRPLFKKLEAYVNFVNAHFGNKETNKQKEKK
jgi:hypothetical protein